MGRPGTGVGRCAAVTEDFSRTGVWNALYDRSCYATTGPRILVFFRVNGQRMGSIMSVEPEADRHIQWRVVGTGPLKRIDLLRNNEVVECWKGGDSDRSETFSRSKPLGKEEWWHLRVIQRDEEMAGASPVWVESR